MVNWRGFFVEGGATGEYLGNVNPNPGCYYELERIRGGMYHKNTDAWVKGLANKINSFLGGDSDYFVEKKAFSIEEETWNDGAMEAGGWLVAGIAFKGLSKAAGALFNGAGRSIWKLGPGPRGFVYEEMLGLKGTFKSSNFPVIDAFYRGVATSIKTMELTGKSYLKENAVYNTMKGYIDKLVNFRGAT